MAFRPLKLKRVVIGVNFAVYAGVSVSLRDFLFPFQRDFDVLPRRFLCFLDKT